MYKKCGIILWKFHHHQHGNKIVQIHDAKRRQGSNEECVGEREREREREKGRLTKRNCPFGTNVCLHACVYCWPKTTKKCLT